MSSWLSGVLDPGNPAGVRCARAIAPRKEIATKIHITGAGTAALEQCGYPLHGIPFACATQIEQYTGLAQGNGLLFPIHIDPAARYLIHLLPQLFRRGTSGRCSAEVPQVTDTPCGYMERTAGKLSEPLTYRQHTPQLSINSIGYMGAIFAAEPGQSRHRGIPVEKPVDAPGFHFSGCQNGIPCRPFQAYAQITKGVIQGKAVGNHGRDSRWEIPF